ncbi:MAG: Gfo/Idh/MocA family oxidoreductase [FCB group bacterium]|jgi:predicted dehydrogenase|nr:Gfo/Idh/MocA family oxidoreductase [FCB group bacterium]
MQGKTVSRRIFLMGSAAAAAGMATMGRASARTVSPNEKLNIAAIGAGGRGRTDLKWCATENIVALCDVDDATAAKTYEEYPNAKRYKDYRVMLEKQKDIDAVIVATPDHSHALASMTALRMGKHVYCEKPLTHTIYEARKLTETARELKLATQMGIQGHSDEGIRRICEWIAADAIGPVHEVHIWTDRPKGWWAQGVERPTDTPPVPSTLDWDLWLGPAPERPYHSAYVPFQWRGWWDFGCGSLGDMGCHLMDAPYWALDLGSPTSVEAHSTAVNGETAPLASMVYYDFPARGDKPPVKMTWYDGGLMPQRPQELPDDMPLGNNNGGLIIVGEKGKIVAQDENAQNPRLLPESLAKEFENTPQTIPRSIGHHEDWVAACKGGAPGGAHFDYSGPLTENVLLGNLAIRLGKKLYWDAPNMKCTNAPEADAFIRKQYRAGWEL